VTDENQNWELLCEFLCKRPLLKLTLTVLRAVDQFTVFIPTTAQQQKIQI